MTEAMGRIGYRFRVVADHSYLVDLVLRDLADPLESDS